MEKRELEGDEVILICSFPFQQAVLSPDAVGKGD